MAQRRTAEAVLSDLIRVGQDLQDLLDEARALVGGQASRQARPEAEMVSMSHRGGDATALRRQLALGDELAAMAGVPRANASKRLCIIGCSVVWDKGLANDSPRSRPSHGGESACRSPAPVPCFPPSPP